MSDVVRTKCGEAESGVEFDPMSAQRSGWDGVEFGVGLG